MRKRIESMLRGILVWRMSGPIRFGCMGSEGIYQALSSTFRRADRISRGRIVNVGYGALLDAKGEICFDDGCVHLLAVMVFSRNGNFNQEVRARPYDDVLLVALVHPGRYVWPGTSAIVPPGVSIVEGAAIGADVVVAKGVNLSVVGVGNLALVVRFRDASRFVALAQEPPFVRMPEIRALQ